MGALTDTYNTSFIVKRNVTVSATGTDVATAVYTGSCVVRPISRSADLLDANNYGKEFRLWADYTENVQAGDLIVISDENYGVLGVNYYQDLENGDESHLEMRIIKR